MNLKKTVATICTVSTIVCITPLQTAIAAEVRANNDKPNFVTIVIDDMGFSDMGAFGGEVPTPNMDKLADGGITLTNFHTAPTSTPSRAMLFTGKDNHQAGMGTMGGWQHPAQEKREIGYEGFLPLYVPTFFELLQTGGYYTMMTGKWDMLEDAPVDELSNYFAANRGFDDTRATLMLGGDTQFSEEDGTVITAHVPGKYEYYKREHSLYNDNGKEIEKFPREFYSTEYYTDMAIEMVDKWQSESQGKPFYLNVSHTAPHTPWQAPPEVTAKYLDVYAQGWDVIRQQRFERQKQLGLWSQELELPPRPDDVPAWDSLSEAEQKFEAKKMAIYAAMIDILDQNVKRLVDHLKEIGEYENTVFFIFSDNGAASVLSGFNVPARGRYLNETFDTFCYQDGKLDNECYENMGTRHWYGGASEGWAMLSNTPFNRYKKDTFEGGVHTLGFLHYPQAKITGEKHSCLTSIMDIAPTILEMAGVVYPTTYNGQYNSPMEGVSMANLFEDTQDCDQSRWIGWELDSGKGLRYGDWKLSQKWDDSKTRWDEQWYLFNLKNDPFEREDLVKKEPEKFQEMLALYSVYATKNNVIDISGIRLTELGALSESGQQTEEAMVTGGITVNYGRIYGAEKTAKQFVDSVAIDGQIRPKMEHRGLAADVLVLGMYSASPDAQPVPLALTETGLEIWDEQTVATLPTFMTISELPDRLSIPIYEGIAVGPIGHFDLWFGYLLADGTLVYNDEVIKFNVTE